MPSSECGWCERNMRTPNLVESCTEDRCPWKTVPKPDSQSTKPLSQMTHREMIAVYNEDEE